jgi:hypothetical protein
VSIDELGNVRHSQRLVGPGIPDRLLVGTHYHDQAAKAAGAMAARLGELLYWTATILAGLIVIGVIAGYISSINEGEAIIPVVALLVAAVIWLIGRACRAILGGR